MLLLRQHLKIYWPINLRLNARGRLVLVLLSLINQSQVWLTLNHMHIHRLPFVLARLDWQAKLPGDLVVSVLIAAASSRQLGIGHCLALSIVLDLLQLSLRPHQVHVVVLYFLKERQLAVTIQIEVRVDAIFLGHEQVVLSES